MAKMTLLEIVQDILNDMDSDPVNSIIDTEESEQIAQIVATTYRLMMNTRDWPHTKKLVNLIATTDSSKPTHMTFNVSIKRVDGINYNKRKSTDTREKYENVKWKEPEEFLRFTNNRNSNNSDTDVITDPSGVKLLITNDTAPTYYTTFDDETIVFDSYDNTVDSVLQSDKTQVIAYVIPDFSVEDDFTPDLPEEAFGELLEMAKVRAQAKLRQFEDALSLQEAQKQGSWNSRNAWTVKGGVRYPNYGRRSSKYHRDPTFKQGRT